MINEVRLAKDRLGSPAESNDLASVPDSHAEAAETLAFQMCQEKTL